MGDHSGRGRRYLVTGAAGFIGSHLCERLLLCGNRVRAVDRFSLFYGRDAKEANLEHCVSRPGFELIEGDIADPCVLDGLLTGVDGVFHLAAQPGVRDSWGLGFADYVADNIVATQRLLEALRHHQVPLVFASSSSVYGEAETRPVTELGITLRPVSPYGLTKLAAEHLVRIYVDQYGAQAACLRYFTVYGPRQRPDMAFARFTEAAIAGEPLELLGDGTQTRDFSYVDDVVDATIRALAAPSGRVYNIGGGAPTTIREVIDALGEVLGTEVTVVCRPAAPGDVRHTWADTRRAREELGWEPRTSLRTGLATQVAWVMSRQVPRDQHPSDNLLSSARAVAS